MIKVLVFFHGDNAGHVLRQITADKYVDILHVEAERQYKEDGLQRDNTMVNMTCFGCCEVMG
jgi:hypothetical protein